MANVSIMIPETKKVCPVIKTCQALYRGGFVASEDDSMQVTIDQIDYIFDEAPVHIGLNAFNTVRDDMTYGNSENDFDDPKEKKGSGESEQSEQEILESFKAADKLHELEVRESIRKLTITGSAEIPTKQELVSRYGIGKTLRDKEQSMVSRIKELYPQMKSL